MIEIKAYKLECGKKFYTKKAALKHERECKCWTNPKYRTCKTCKFGELKWDSNGMEDEPSLLHQWKQWNCNNPEFNYDLHFTAAHENAADLCINCPKWTSKELQQEQNK